MEKKHEKDSYSDSDSNSKKKHAVGFGKWDCGSTLYDSFELNSFKRHLDSALLSTADDNMKIPTRTHSMPHLISHSFIPISSNSISSDIITTTTTTTTTSENKNKNKNNKNKKKISPSHLIKLVRSVFPSSKKQMPQYQRNIIHYSSNIIDYDNHVDQYEAEKTTRSGRWVLVYDQEDDNEDQKKANANAKTALSTIPEVPEVPDHDDHNQLQDEQHNNNNNNNNNNNITRRRLSLSLVRKSNTILSDRFITNTNTNTKSSSSNSTTRILSVSCT